MVKYDGNMKAVVFENRKIHIRDIPVPSPRDDEALVKINLAGICATDVALLNGYYDFTGIPGHEFVGEVVSAPSCPDLEGKRVVADINCGCGQCDVCETGDFRHCRNRTTVGISGCSGVFAQFCALPTANLYQVPAGIADEDAVFAEPLAAVLEITCQMDVSKYPRIAILGDGKLGLLCALVLNQITPGVVLYGHHPKKLEIASARGVSTVCNEGDIPKEIRAKKFDMVVEATGHPDGINTAIDMVRPQGLVVVKTTVSKKSEIDLAKVVVNELTLMGSRCGDIQMALDFMQARQMDLHSLVEAIYPLRRFEAAFARATEKQSLKVLIRNDKF